MELSQKKIIIPGGSGFLGRCLSKWFYKRGYLVVIFSRNHHSFEYAKTVIWDGKSLGSWIKELEDASALVNLTGRWVNCRYNKKNRDDIMNSRVLSTRILGEAITKCQNPPPVWLNSSTATIYLHRYDTPNDEYNHIIAPHKDAKDLFSVDVAQSWEREFESINLQHIRKNILRTSFIFGSEPGGVYETMRKLVLLRLGGKMGNGEQYVSWLHTDDFCNIIQWLIENNKSQGIYNLCTPNPLPNKEIMGTIRKILNVSYGFSPTNWMLELGAFILRTETELIVKSRYVYPKRLLEEGYQFLFPDFEQAIRNIEKNLSIS